MMDPELAAPVVDAPPEPTLAEHEAAYAEPRPTSDDADSDRAPDGRFRPRQRAVSQRANAGDVERIASLTKEYHEAVKAAGLDLKQDDGESNRVFEVRKRVELAKALAASKNTPAATAATVSPAVVSGPSPSAPNGAASGVSLPADFPPQPKQDDFSDWSEYVRATAKWEARAEYALARQADEQQRAAESFRHGFQTRMNAAAAKYPDFKAVVLDAPTMPYGADSLIHKWVLEHGTGPDIAYHLFKNPSDAQRIVALPPADQFYELSLLGQRLTSTTSAPQVASTRSTAAPAVIKAPSPPNLVRSGALHAGDEPPGDNASMSEHERAYYPRSRR